MARARSISLRYRRNARRLGRTGAKGPIPPSRPVPPFAAHLDLDLDLDPDPDLDLDLDLDLDPDPDPDLDPEATSSAATSDAAA